MPFVSVEGLQIHYRQAGSGPPLLLLHGLGSHSESWKHQLNGLSDEFTVIAWDTPGYGKSEDPAEEIRFFEDFAEVLKKFVEQLQIEPFYLLGHSMGSTLALAFYQKYPQAVRKLILADATRGGAAKDGDQNQVKLKNRLHAIETQTPLEIAEARSKNLLGPDASEEVQKEAKRIYAQIRPVGYRSVSYSLYHADQSAVLGKIHVPTLILCGEMDQITPVSESKLIHQKIPNSKLVIIPRTGHLCYQEDPEFFNEHVRIFLR